MTTDAAVDADPTYRAVGALVLPADEPELDSRHEDFDREKFEARTKSIADFRDALLTLEDRGTALATMLKAWTASLNADAQATLD